ncbi:MAG: gluconokinase [Candidatus Omnitrophica bacterium]|nr:gluconokinase [Candidatus Omnitrophota bacterium]
MLDYQSPFILSIDIGTSSIRAQVYDAGAKPLDGVGRQIHYSITNTPEGGAFIDLQILCDLIFQVIDAAVHEAHEIGIGIDAVSCCTFWHSAAGVDSEGNPCTPLLFWNDTRPESILPELKETLDPIAFTKRTGCPMHASYLPAKITWLHRAMPEQARQARYWMSAGEYFLYKITGHRACSISMASASGLLDSQKCEWDAVTLAQIPAQLDQLSPLCDAQDALPGLLPSFARRWPSLTRAAWRPALGDGACSNIGCGCSSPNRVAVMVGTSGAMRAAWRGEFQEPPSGLWCYRIDKQRPIKGGALSNGGNIMAWLRDTLDFSSMGVSKNDPSSLNEISRQLMDLPPDGHGLTFLPFLAGQRSPHWNPNMTGTLHGIRLSTKPIHIFQAALEAVAYRFKMIHNLLQDSLADDHVIVATGGGLLHSSAWVQILADVFGRDVYISKISEASCRGAALVALESQGAVKDIADIDLCVSVKRSPNPEAHAVYQSAIQRHIDFEAHRIESF